jgi:L-rhamnonate dehydratase
MLGRYTAYKLHLGLHPQEQLIEATATARARIGPATPLMVDAWMQWDVERTLRFAQEAAQLRLDWIEEPLPPDELYGYERLRLCQCPVPIAGGEHEFTAAAFIELIDCQAHQIVQPDVCWCGGMTELVKIYRFVQNCPEYRVRVCPHRGAERWALPALAALDPQPLAESGRPWLTWVGGQPPIRAGYIEVPDGHGFGVKIDESALDVIY